MAKQKSLSKNSIFFLIYNVLNVLFPFITGVYVARVLLPGDIGQVAYAQNIAQYFAILAFLGIPTYGLREIAKARKDKEELNKVHSELFYINLISTLVFLSLYIILIFAVPEFRNNLKMFLIVGVSIAMNAMDNSWLYEGLEEFGFISLRNIIFKVVAFTLLVIFVRGEEDYYIYAAITVAGTVGNNLLNILNTPRFVKFRFKGLNFKRHLKPIFLLVVVNLAIEVYTLVDTTMLGIFCEKEVVAFYSYGSKINKIFLQVINTFTMVLVPRISLHYKEGKLDEFNGLLTKTLKIIIILAIPMIVGIQFVSQFIICKLYGDVYIRSANVLRILSAALIISPVGYLLGSRVLLVVGREFKMVISVGAGAVINVIGNLILIRYWGEYGAAAASIISEIAVMLVYVLQGRKYFKLNRFWDTLLKVILASAVMGGYLFGCSYIPLNGWAVFTIQVVGAILIYFSILLITKEQMIWQYAYKFLKRFKKMKDVTNNGPSAEELTLEQIQSESFKVLLKIKEICEENDIKYFLAYGTLIGAIRHDGFIPWDDDIDVWLPRPDYDKLIQYCIDNAESLKPLELKHYTTCKEYIYPIARLSNSEYKINYTNAKDYGLGIFVDLYPLDGLNLNDGRHIKKFKRLNRKIIFAGSTKMPKSKSALKNFLKLPYYAYTKCINLNKALKKYDELAKRYSFDEEKYCWLAWDHTNPDGSLICYESSDFDKSENKSFEGEQMSIPTSYDKLLTETYGDYMQLPPEEERVGHHFYTVTRK